MLVAGDHDDTDTRFTTALIFKTSVLYSSPLATPGNPMCLFAASI